MNVVGRVPAVGWSLIFVALSRSIPLRSFAAQTHLLGGDNKGGSDCETSAVRCAG
jgi:hypothetical protein